MLELQKLTSDVCKVAREAGEFIRKNRETFTMDKVESKHSHDYVSYVDRETENLVVSRLRSLLPDASFLTEEGTADVLSHSASRYEWVVDPLDGTTNFVHGVAPYCVCIALKEGQELLLGVVYEVCLDEMFSAWKGGGAYLNGNRITVSGTSSLDDSLVIFGFPYNTEAWKPFYNLMVNDLYGHCASVRNFGSAEAELCYVASGRAEVYMESYIKPWDVLAGAIILQEAGGKLSDYTGGDEYWRSGDYVLATNKHVHESVLNVVMKHAGLLE